jgi:hypothetical protein
MPKDRDESRLGLIGCDSFVRDSLEMLHLAQDHFLCSSIYLPGAVFVQFLSAMICLLAFADPPRDGFDSNTMVKEHAMHCYSKLSSIASLRNFFFEVDSTLAHYPNLAMIPISEVTARLPWSRTFCFLHICRKTFYFQTCPLICVDGLHTKKQISVSLMENSD